jgi:8-oxo-dGTP diphosphatase
VDYANPVPAAGVFILEESSVLWVRRGEAPKRGGWSLPSGFQEWEEDICDCARREAREETGLEVELGPVLGAYSAFDDPRHNALLVVFLARAVGGREAPGDDADALAWHPLDQAPQPIAWESHRRALSDLRARLAADD